MVHQFTAPIRGKKKRFTISVPQDVADEIAAARAAGYVGTSQEEALRRLITRGIRVWKQQSGD